MQQQRMREAIDFAVAHETPWSRDNSEPWGIHGDDPPPWNVLRGPIHARGGVSGTLLLDGRQVAEWGEPRRADLTFSVAKTYLALLAGIAHDRGLLPDLDQPVGALLPGIGFDRGRNAAVCWRHLLQQTSEWEGVCLGMPDQVDHFRVLSFQGTVVQGRKGDRRELQAPGSFWEYNDVRVNQLSLALLHLFRRPLPEVFAETILVPLGARDEFRWEAYRDGWVDIDGRRLPCVPGGSHWGGGVSISSGDQARVGQMLLDRGRGNGRQVLSQEWVRLMSQPCSIAPFYGLMLWLNHERCIFPQAPATSSFMIGAGGQFIWLEPERRMLLVVRWLDTTRADEFFGRVLAAIDA
jgi:CubicO group peptidase (beta-lactamase class C family)